MTSAIVSLLTASVVATRPPPRTPTDIDAIACLTDGTLLGIGYPSAVVRRGDAWVPLKDGDRAYDLWAAPDGQAFLCCFDRFTVVGFLGSLDASERWEIPWKLGHAYRFSYSDGPIFANSDRVYRLAPHGVVQKIGRPPQNLTGFRAHQGPVLIHAPAGWIACFETSLALDDNMRGHCIGPSRRYNYRVEFEQIGPDIAERDFGRPFACGDVVVSAFKGATWARQISDGAVVGRTDGAAHRGSRCLADGRILVVGPRDITVYDGPQFRRSWHRDVGAAIRDAALCGTALTVLLEKDSSLVTIDLAAAGVLPAPH